MIPLVFALCINVPSAGGQCHDPTPAHGEAFVQLGRQLATQPGYIGLLTWLNTKVPETVVMRPPKRALPPCNASPLQACLPTFFVIGVQKGGTSTLYQVMKTHAQIKPAFKKELLWFNGNFENLRCNPPGEAPSAKHFLKYLQHFPRLDGLAPELTGEFSATYLHCWCCPQAMRRLMPSVRLIAQLRDPINRARSRWLEQHTWAKKVETYASFDMYVEKELPLLQDCLAEADSLEAKAHCAAASNILGLSLYDSVLELWLKHFEPQDLLVTYLEQYAADPQAVLSSIHAHLGVDDQVYPSSLLQKRFNKEGHYGWKNAKSALQVDNQTSGLAKLYDFYRPHMLRLHAMAEEGRISALPFSWVSRWRL